MEKYQTFLPRFVAMAIDIFIFLPLGIFDVWIRAAEPSPILLYIWLPILNLAFPVYAIAMNGLYGQTLGKMAMNVKIVDASRESSISFYQAIMRDLPQLLFNGCLIFLALPQFQDGQENLDFSANPAGSILFIVMIIWGIGDILMFFLNDKRRALHDYLAGTVVIKMNVE
jgi:uncharacterized RDD family membrane protein YckC